MPITCPHCQTKLDEPADQALTCIYCYSCGHKIALPPPIQSRENEATFQQANSASTNSSPPPVQEDDIYPAAPTIDTESFRRAGSAAKKHLSAANQLRKKYGVSPVKTAMLVATAIWVVSMPVLGILGFLAVNPKEDLIQIGGRYFDGFTRVSYTEGELFAMRIEAAFTTGLCCPTSFYVIVMTILGVIYFATKK